MSRHFNPLTQMFDEDDEGQDLFPCRDCQAAVYWGDHYSQDGSKTSALFNASNSRKHVCPGMSTDDFDVVPE